MWRHLDPGLPMDDVTSSGGRRALEAIFSWVFPGFGLGREVTRYLAVGALNAAFTFLVFVGGLYAIRLHYLFALVLAAALGFVLTYWLNFVWVFRPEARFGFRGRFVKYVATNTATVGLNLVALHYVVERAGFDPLYGQAGLMVLIVAVNFLAAKLWSLRPAK